MDGDLVLNIAATSATISGTIKGKRGGRWTDRLKAKRVAKRKSLTDEPQPSLSHDLVDSDPDLRPAKRLRKHTSRADSEINPNALLSGKPAALRSSNQIISSLFSSNPKIDLPLAKLTSTLPSKPSNAPLSNSSTFEGLGLDPLLTSHLSTKLSIIKPTAIQQAALSALLPKTTDEDSFRDVFLQSQTGSGKTLSFLLPIIQDLLPLSSLSYIDRSIGTLAIIIAPTRELAKQISDLLEALLQLRLRPDNETGDSAESSSGRLTRWLVSGLLSGGATRTHEKARLRKGLPILVSTPGRLLDHLQNTSSFNVGKCRWLVLDEADRLMELGFEETISGIIKSLDGRKKLAEQAVEEGSSMEVGGWDWSRRRRTVLCSATIREDVRKLAGTTLLHPLVIKALEKDNAASVLAPSDGAIDAVVPSQFTPPSQLSQKYIISPLKLRLVTLIALLRNILAKSASNRGTKIIVFFTCTDSVDFHWLLLGGLSMGDHQKTERSSEASDEGTDSDNNNENNQAENEIVDKVCVQCPLLPSTSVFRLHGSLPAPIRLASLKGFSASATVKSEKARPPASSSILFCTSVASRGLDLPLVRAVIQYDLPTEGGATEYVHRVGRTARAGKGGEAWSLVAPSESGWVKWVEQKMHGEDPAPTSRNVRLEGVQVEIVLRSGFGGKGTEYEERATEVQLAFERWVLRSQTNSELARKAFSSHMRAYATHPSNEKHIFHIKHLHLGHLAKAFALRIAPGAVASGNKKGRQVSRRSGKFSGVSMTDKEESHDASTEKRMQNIVRSQGRLTKKGGVMVSSGASEFQIVTGAALEKIAGSST